MSGTTNLLQEVDELLGRDWRQTASSVDTTRDDVFGDSGNRAASWRSTTRRAPVSSPATVEAAALVNGHTYERGDETAMMIFKQQEDAVRQAAEHHSACRQRLLHIGEHIVLVQELKRWQMQRCAEALKLLETELLLRQRRCNEIHGQLQQLSQRKHELVLAKAPAAPDHATRGPGGAPSSAGSDVASAKAGASQPPPAIGVKFAAVGESTSSAASLRDTPAVVGMGSAVKNGSRHRAGTVLGSRGGGVVVPSRSYFAAGPLTKRSVDEFYADSWARRAAMYDSQLHS